MTFTVFIIFCFIMGLLFGSFANVCIHRVPREESVVTPRSHCPSCNTLIRWYDNIPLLSFCMLRGRCRHCGTGISVQYPIVELVVAIIFVIAGIRFFAQPFFVPFVLYFMFVLVTISFIDLYHKIIPDIFSFSLVIVGLVGSLFNESLATTPLMRFILAFAGGVAGAGLLWLIGVLGKKIFKQDAMGLGDVKLIAGIGVYLGISQIFGVVVVAAVLGSLYGGVLLLLKKIQRREYIPFGPFLAAAAVLMFLWQ